MENPQLIREGVFTSGVLKTGLYAGYTQQKETHKIRASVCNVYAYARRRAPAFAMKSTELINIEHTIPSTHFAVRIGHKQQSLVRILSSICFQSTHSKKQVDDICQIVLVHNASRPKEILTNWVSANAHDTYAAAVINLEGKSFHSANDRPE